ncbi:polysaccharide biosynthesis/export family protein [Daejeonella oryzae]|uniref:polysaccharide biosynthesis/export family protein n=1 Tax=Daejeonella oryzae TaxID=1122943 RepID=UPI0004205B55|nr:polysaccharide biosynthesis/export family protein [Daejeonella oryzae]
MKSNYIYFILCILLFSSCEPQRNLVYFSEGDSPKDNRINLGNAEIKIQSNDLLKISVSSLSVESNSMFNTAANQSGYRVDNNGSINFPMVGTIKLDGMTLEQAQAKISTDLEKYVKNPIVNVDFLNFKITVIGEVNKPSSFTIADERVNLLEALGLAGDLTAYGKRENILIIRETAGERTMTRINLNNKDVVNSPYFYLKQNDIVYVEPDPAKALSVSRSNRTIPIITASISVISVIIQALLRFN